MREDNKIEKIDFYCRCCKKTMKMSYVLTGNEEAPVLPGMIIRCHTHKCVKVTTLMKFTEGEIIAQADRQGKVYI